LPDKSLAGRRRFLCDSGTTVRSDYRNNSFSPRVEIGSRNGVGALSSALNSEVLSPE